MEAARIPWRPLGRLLVEQGLLSEDQLEHALEEQESTNRRLGETLIDLGFVSHAALSHALAEQYGIEPKAETGFGTGLRAEIERRLDPGRDDERKPAPQISDTAPALRLVPEPDTNTPELDTILELPELGIEKLVVCRIGKSPLPGDARPCVFAQPAQTGD